MRTTAFCRASVVVGIVVVCSVAAGQASKPGTGTVTGHVICEDTQKPARFASVMLYSVPSSVNQAMPKLDSSSDAAAVQAVIQQQMSNLSYVQTQTDIDGSFVAEDVPPGDYYVMASVVGYVQPRNLLQAAFDRGEDITKSVAGIPMVHVGADRSAMADVSVTRGAAVEGRVLWDDGSAVTGAMVWIDPTGKKQDLPMQFLMMGVSQGLNGLLSSTDDRGHYRVSGLAAGEYTVRVVLQTRMQTSMNQGRMNMNGMTAEPLIVYAPSAFHKSSAKPVTLNAGEEQADEDVTFNLSGTHTVSGRITSAEDHHALSRAVVRLTDTSDKTFVRSSALDSDGTFRVSFVPQGTYTMEVSNGADTVPAETKTGGLIRFNTDKTVRSYEHATQQVIVTDNDVTGQNIELTPSKTVKPEMSSGIGAVAGGIPQ